MKRRVERRLVRGSFIVREYLSGGTCQRGVERGVGVSEVLDFHGGVSFVFFRDPNSNG